MAKAVDHTQAEFGSVRTGRATPALVEHLKVDYYGAETELRQMAGFSVPEARLLVVSPYDKGSLPAIEKAIQGSDLGITPSNDGTVIRLSFPVPTEQRRKELVKVVKQKAEEGGSRCATSPVGPSRARGHAEGRRPLQSTSSSGWRRSSTRSPTSTWPRSTSCWPTRSRSSSRSDSGAGPGRARSMGGNN